MGSLHGVVFLCHEFFFSLQHLEGTENVRFTKGVIWLFVTVLQLKLLNQQNTLY